MSLSIIAAFGFCVLYGLQIVLQSSFLRTSVHPIQLMFLTNAASFFLLTVFHIATNRGIFRIRLSRSTWVFFLVATVLWISADMSSMIGLSISSSVNLSILSRLQLFVTYIGAVMFLGEAYTPLRVVALILAFCGSLLTVVRGQTLVFTTGDILFLVFTAAISVSGLLRQKISGRISVHQMTYLMYGISSVVTGICTVVFAPIHTIPVPGFIPVNALLSLLGFTCVNYAIAKGGAAQFSLVSSMLPFITAIFSYFLLKEVPTPYQLIGGMIIIGSILLFLMPSWKKNR